MLHRLCGVLATVAADEGRRGAGVLELLGFQHCQVGSTSWRRLSHSDLELSTPQHCCLLSLRRRADVHCTDPVRQDRRGCCEQSSTVLVRQHQRALCASPIGRERC